MRLHDTMLDNPSAEQQFEELVEDVMENGIVSKNSEVTSYMIQRHL